MDLTRLEQILDRASSRRITVIGDLMLDEFVWGKVGRISPEAPVPVVEVTGESFYPGGAANVARNLREFVDPRRDHRSAGQRSQRPATPGIIVGTKDRYLECSSRTNAFTPSLKPVSSRAINRWFVSIAKSLSTPSTRTYCEVVAEVRNSIPETDAIIFEDYGKGFVTTELVSQIVGGARAAGKIVAADPNPQHPSTGAALQLSNQTALKLSLQQGFHGVMPDKLRQRY